MCYKFWRILHEKGLHKLHLTQNKCILSDDIHFTPIILVCVFILKQSNMNNYLLCRNSSQSYGGLRIDSSWARTKIWSWVMSSIYIFFSRRNLWPSVCSARRRHEIVVNWAYHCVWGLYRHNGVFTCLWADRENIIWVFYRYDSSMEFGTVRVCHHGRQYMATVCNAVLSYEGT